MRGSLGGVLSYLRGLATDDQGGAEDGQLLARFAQGDAQAFTTLVGRYAPLVWGVCSRLLGPSPDAEDAFQATFVVLVRKAAGLTDGRSLGPWLHRVAWRTATKARVAGARRQARQRPASFDRPMTDASPEDKELHAILDEEVARLPERYRRPVVLCYLEGLTNEEAALRLDCPKGTIVSRLSRARDHLRDRLARRGVGPAVTAVPFVSKPAPAALVESVARAGPLLRAGVFSGLSPSVLILAKGVVFGMFLRKLEIVVLALLVLALAGSGVGWLARRPITPTAQAAPVAVEAKKEEQKPAAKEKAAPASVKAATSEDIAQALKRTIEFSGLDDPQTRLIEVLDGLTHLYHVPFIIDDRAFQLEAMQEVEKTEIVRGKPFPPLKASLQVVLAGVLARVPVPSGATFLVRKNHIEITTGKFVEAALGLSREAGPEKPIQPLLVTRLVWQHFRKESLEKALDELAEASGYSIILDARVEEKAGTKVTARLINVPVDTAVRLLADMVGLAVVRMDNVFYVTSPENAKKLSAEQSARGLERRSLEPFVIPAEAPDM